MAAKRFRSRPHAYAPYSAGEPGQHSQAAGRGAAARGGPKSASKGPPKGSSRGEASSSAAGQARQPRREVASIHSGDKTLEARFEAVWTERPNGSGAEGSLSTIKPIYPEQAIVVARGRTFLLSLRADGTGHASAADGAILAPMPGKVIAVDVSDGDSVTAGQRLMVLEAMKMEHKIIATGTATVTSVHFQPGESVDTGDLLVSLEQGEGS